MIRFHADQNVDLAIVRGLRKRGTQITFAPDLNMSEATDEEHLEFAYQKKILLTHAQDFLRLNSQGLDHYGIIHITQQKLQVGRIVRSLEEYSIYFNEEDFRRQLIYLR